MKLQINRRRVDPGDNLVDLVINGKIISALEATNLLILKNCRKDVSPFKYYHWHPNGIFRNAMGTFKWYFQLDEDLSHYPKTVVCYFEEDIDFENDTSEEIFRKLQDRLIKIWDALYEYKEESDSNMLLAFEPTIEGEI